MKVNYELPTGRTDVFKKVFSLNTFVHEVFALTRFVHIKDLI